MRNTVGAGDALVGGFLTGWLGHGLTREDLDDETTINEAVRAAVVVASITCSRQGAQPLWRYEVHNAPEWNWF